MTEKLLVPDIGDFQNVEVIEILKNVGEKIKKNDPIVTIESDKSSVEVPSIFEGTVKSINVKIGDKVSKGSLLAIIDSDKNKEKDDKPKEEKKEKVVSPELEKTVKKKDTSKIIIK